MSRTGFLCTNHKPWFHIFKTNCGLIIVTWAISLSQLKKPPMARFINKAEPDRGRGALVLTCFMLSMDRPICQVFCTYPSQQLESLLDILAEKHVCPQFPLNNAKWEFSYTYWAFFGCGSGSDKTISEYLVEGGPCQAPLFINTVRNTNPVPWTQLKPYSLRHLWYSLTLNDTLFTFSTELLFFSLP